MTLDRMKLSAQTVRENIAIMEECKEPDDAGYYLQLEHEKFVLDCIEKQIPKKPRVDSENWLCCPKCNETFAMFDMLNRRLLCCGCCGQKLDWSEVDAKKRSDTE